MMNKIKTNPALAAAFYFVLTWIGYPIAALLSSYIRGISFTAAATRPYMIVCFVVASIIAAFQMYNKVKNSTTNR